ncbi:MAG: diguanylate cyclase, partial [Gallionellaceae bacterium]|nr:diguanylate cyclase [Gallionellaceae bacterium]
MDKPSILISEYQAAIRAMRKGKFNVSVPAEHSDEIGKLGDELNQLARELEKKFSELSKLKKISEEITAGYFLDDVLSRIYENFYPVIPYNRIGCALLSNENKEATAYWAKSDGSVIKLKNGFTAPMAGSSLQPIIETGHPRILNDLESYLAEHPASTSTRLIVEEGLRSSLTCPLITEGKPVGFLFFSSREKNTYQSIHQDIFLQIAGQVSILIEKSRLYQQLYDLNQKLILTQHNLHHQATHDALTGIYNRRAILEQLEAQLARARRHSQPLSIILLDVDHFKEFNSTYGHLAGDNVLRASASRMESCLREYDCIGRYGGEEFLAVLDNVGFETALKTAERLRHSVSADTVIFDSKQLAVTISAGVAVAENCAEVDPDKIISAADQALYKAKSNG